MILAVRREHLDGPPTAITPTRGIPRDSLQHDRANDSSPRTPSPFTSDSKNVHYAFVPEGSRSPSTRGLPAMLWNRALAAASTRRHGALASVNG